jgi:hypothetical protein
MSNREKQQKYANELAMDSKQNSDIQGNRNNAWGGGGSGSGGYSDNRVKEHESYNIPGLTKPQSTGGGSPISNYMSAKPVSYTSSDNTANDGYNYATQSPIYTSKAKAVLSPYMPMADSIDQQLGQVGGSRNAANPTQYNLSSNYNNDSNSNMNNNYKSYSNGNNSNTSTALSSSANPIRNVSVGRGRSSGGGQSTIQLY